MKFMGLILMCAASIMALVLPALGVVKFPVLDQQALQALSAKAESLSQSQEASALTVDPQASPGLLVAAQVSGEQNPPGALPLPDKPSLGGPDLGKIPFTQIDSQKIGLGVWLLLLPALLVGLGMWTFGSSPKASSR